MNSLEDVIRRCPVAVAINTVLILAIVYFAVKGDFLVALVLVIVHAVFGPTC